jgi:hypothetical protein
MAHLVAQPGGPAPAQRVRTVPPARRRSGLPGTLRSELTKLRSVRSTYITLAGFFAGAVAATIAISASARSVSSRPGFDPVAYSLQGNFFLAEVIIMVTGALVITSEYGTRMVGTSLTAMPRRGVLYGAKAIALACLMLVVALVTSVTSFFVGQAILGPVHAGVSITSPGALRAVVLTAAFVTCYALLAFGLGAVIRHTAGAVTAPFALVFVIPQIAQFLSASTYHAVERWLPGGSAVNQLVVTRHTGQQYLFGPYGEMAVFAAYAAIAVVAGLLVFRRRDA